MQTYRTLYTALVRSQLEHAVAIWKPHYATHSDLIERIQKRYVKTLQFRFNTPKLNYTDAISKLKYSTLHSRRMELDAVVLYNVCHSRYDCADIIGLLQFRVPGRATRSSALFHLLTARTNAGVRAPMYRLCDNYNKVFHSIDIFASSSSQYKRSVNKILLTYT